LIHDSAFMPLRRGLGLLMREGIMDRTQVVIIGGGATGAGILWDLSLRGISAVLLEKRDLANGATGRCHGLLHSGARYVVKDAEAARECLSESRILKTIAPHAVHDVGGLFVRYPQDDPAFFPQWDEACAKVGLPTEKLSPEQALELEPNLPKTILGASTTPDAHVDVFQLTLSNLQAAVAKGGRFMPYCEVTAIEQSNGRVTAVRFTDSRSGEQDRIPCEMVVNAGGGWAQAVAQMAGLDVPVRCDKGSLLVLNHNLVSRVVNRCRKPGDADILVPAGPVCILGTSSITVSGPEGLTADSEELEHLLALGAELVPLMAEARVLRVFSGVRPLYVPKDAGGAAGRDVSRGFVLLDHSERDGRQADHLSPDGRGHCQSGGEEARRRCALPYRRHAFTGCHRSGFGGQGRKAVAGSGGGDCRAAAGAGSGPVGGTDRGRRQHGRDHLRMRAGDPRRDRHADEQRGAGAGQDHQ